jgi:hypothetical protein
MNHLLIGCDTDSLFLCKQDQTPWSKEEQELFLKALNEQFPEHIKFDHDGVYESAVISKAKNYIMKKANGEIVVKGSAFKSSTKEPALKQMNEGILNEMLGNNDLSVIISIYKKYLEEAKNITNIKRWSTKKTYTEKVEESERLNETKVKDAIKEAINKKVLSGIQQGDKVYLYQTVDGMKQKTVKGVPQFYKKTGEPIMVENKILKVIDLYNHDADSTHYMKRVEDTLYILETVLPVEEIIKSV